MGILKHCLFFKLDENLDFKKLKDSYCFYENGFYKLDIINNELFFLKANQGLIDLEFSKDKVKLDNAKNKVLKYKRAVKDGVMVEEFDNFYISTMLDFSKSEGLRYYEYERLKLSLCYGLKARDFGMSIGLALRIYSYYLSIFNRYEEIKELLSMFEFIYEDGIIAKLKTSEDFYTNLSCIVLDDDDFYTNDCAKSSFTKIFAKVLRINALNLLKNNQDITKLKILLEFLGFFKLHKKLDLVKKLEKNSRKTAKKISKIAKTYY